MRLTPENVKRIRELVGEIASAEAEVYLFGSRLDDRARGGDVDLLLVLPHAVERPAELTARLAARISRALGGRRVDVLLDAPNLRRLPVHEHARREGKRL